MNLKMMNEAFKRRYSDALTESVDESYKGQLKKALVMRSMNVVANGGNIKDLEIALQSVIEEFFPDKSWWEVTDCNIFMELLGGVNPREVCDMIVDQIKADCCDESLTEGYDAETLEFERKPEWEKGGKWAVADYVVRAYDIKGSGNNRISSIHAFVNYDLEGDVYDISLDIDGNGVDNEAVVTHLQRKFRYLGTDGEGAYSLDTCINRGLVPMIDYLLYQLDDDKLGNICNESLDEAVSNSDKKTDKRFYVYASDDNCVSDSFITKEDAIEFAEDNSYQIVKIHKYYIDRDKHYPDGDPVVVWNKNEHMKEAVSNPERTISKVDKNLSKEVDKDLVRDLTLILENDGEVYRRSITPVINNLKKKKAKGQFDEKLAIQAFFHVVEGALKQPWFYRYYSYNIQTVRVPERYAVAKELLDGFMEEIEFEETIKNENFSLSSVKKSVKESLEDILKDPEVQRRNAEYDARMKAKYDKENKLAKEAKTWPDDKELTYEEAVALAKAYYSQGGDMFYETTDERQFDEEVSESGPMTVGKMKSGFDLYDSVRRDRMGTW